ncbi:MAG TPA: hypothetical protein PKH68_02915 [Paludibacteraceae bacterium]|jgi:hypothetical protein|nr:hypothetical protein [Paludibacteraceae bacterium]
MENRKFEIKIYYTGFCTYEIEAQDEAEAIIKARKLSVNQNEIITNLENWEEADTATDIDNEKSKI